MTLADYISSMRSARSLGFSAGARAAGVDRSTLYRWETGKRTPSYDALRSLCDAWGASILEYEAAEGLRRASVRA